MSASFHSSDEHRSQDQQSVDDEAGTTYAPGDATHEELLRQTAARMPVFFRVLKLLAKRLTAEYEPQVARIGEGQVRAMHVLYEDGDQQVGELAERCGVADPTMSKMLRSLEGNGLVTRSTDPENRRAVWVRLTAQGRVLFDQISARFERSLADLLGGLASEQLVDVLRTVDHFEALAGMEGQRAESASDNDSDNDVDTGNGMRDKSASSCNAGARTIH